MVEHQRLPKTLRIVSALLLVAVIYVGLSFIWHWKIRLMFIVPANDPFADPATHKPSTQKDAVTSLGDQAFFDFKGWYARLTDPMRPRRDPDGKPYFENYEETWYTPFLSALQRKSIFERDEEDTAEYYRLTIIPSFPNYSAQSHEIKIEPNGAITLHSVRNHSSHDPGQFSKEFKSEFTKSLTREEWDLLLGEAKSDEFWEPMSDFESGWLAGLDGSIWLFEKSTPSSYKMVDFWTPLAFTQSDGSRNPIMDEHFGDDVRSAVPYAQLGIRFMIESGFAQKGDFEVTDEVASDSLDPFAP